MAFTFEDYKAALKGAGPKLKENILSQAQFMKLTDLAYPGTVSF